MIKKLLRSIREYRASSIRTAVFAGLEVLLEIIIPFLMSDIIDKGIYGGNMNVLLKLGLAMGILVVLGLVFGFAAGSESATASSGFARNLRKDMYYHIQEFSFANIDKFSTASLVTRLTTDVTNIQLAYMMIIRIAVRAPLMMVFALIMSFWISWKLAIIFLVMIPVLGSGLVWIVYKSHPVFELVFDQYDSLNGVVQENLSGIRVVKSFVREEHEKDKFQKVSTKLFKTFCKAERYMALNAPLMQFVVYVCMILVFWFGARMIVLSGATELTTGELTSLIIYAMQILTSLMMLSMVLVMITIAQSSAERIVEVLDERTITNLINRFYDIEDGKIRYDGININKIKKADLRKSLGIVLQDTYLFTGTVMDNIRYGRLEATNKECIAAAKLANADEFIRRLPDGYNTWLDGAGEDLSQGQRQLLAIARAAVANPPAMILDEATSSIDTRTEKQVQDGMDELMKGRTTFVIAHRLSTIQNSDVIMVLDHGRIIERGDHDDLIAKKGTYYQLYTGAFEME